MKQYRTIGLMSGTSLDGVDIACCLLKEEEGCWSYSIDCAETIPYQAEWKERLLAMPNASAMELAQSHATFGHYLGILARNFSEKHMLVADLVASHGHTIFHQPQNGFSFQLGDGSAIAAECGLPVVSDFRTLDIAFGGQGAPLVPMGDQLLFSDYEQCLNIGGFANISFQHNGHRLAFDVCPANIILNHFSEKLGLPFDKDGLIAASGNINSSLLNKLNQIGYYRLLPPKSLGREWVESILLPVIDVNTIALNDILCTVTEHIAIQLAKTINDNSGHQVLITGGGALNIFLINRLKTYTNAQLIIPDPIIVNYKEALVFALLGVLRYRGETNCLADVTGASENVAGGGIFLPPTNKIKNP